MTQVTPTKRPETYDEIYARMTRWQKFRLHMAHDFYTINWQVALNKARNERDAAYARVAELEARMDEEIAIAREDGWNQRAMGDQARVTELEAALPDLQQLLQDYRKLVIGTTDREPLSPAYAALRALVPPLVAEVASERRRPAGWRVPPSATGEDN
jgi:hypothetical protein